MTLLPDTAQNTNDVQGSKSLCVDIPGMTQSYGIQIGQHIIPNALVQWLQTQQPAVSKIAIITDNHVGPRYEPAISQALEQAGFQTTVFQISNGEFGKSMKSAQAIYELLIEQRFSRNDVILALGGGVVGDLSGYCAATYQRGMRWIQIPTTLLAQVDSSVGGKVAINYGSLKNVIGSFYQPNLVLSDLDTLKTLSDRDYQAGLGEVVKYALIEASCKNGPIEDNTGLPLSDEQPSLDKQLSLFDFLCAHVEAINNRDPQILVPLIYRCCQLKAQVVAADETDVTGHRAILNLGHTFAHAYESISDYGILHGEAVAIGIRKACQLAADLGDFDHSLVDAVAILMQRLNLNSELSNVYASALLLDFMRQDKKNHQDNITLILPKQRPGFVQIRRDISNEAILNVLNAP